MATVEEFWQASREMVDDPQWRVFSYEDDAVQFVCEECQESVWNNRVVVTRMAGDYKITGQYSPEYGEVFFAASEHHGQPPRHYDIVELPPRLQEKSDDEKERYLWVAFIGWNLVNEGPPIEPEPDFDTLELIEMSNSENEETHTKSIDEYNFEDYLNAGIEHLTPGD